MNKYNGDARELTVALLKRSTCAVRCAATLEDSRGIFSWGWNSSGSDGMGEHAERACLRRANWGRLEGSTIYVAAERGRNGKIIGSRPCEACEAFLAPRIARMLWRDPFGRWVEEYP